MDPLVPSQRRAEGDRSFAPQVILGSDDIRVSVGIETGSGDSNPDFGEKHDGSKENMVR